MVEKLRSYQSSWQDDAECVMMLSCGAPIDELSGDGCLLKVIILLREKAMMAMGTAMGRLE